MDEKHDTHENHETQGYDGNSETYRTPAYDENRDAPVRVQDNRVRNYRILTGLLALLLVLSLGMLFFDWPSRSPLEKPGETPAPVEPQRNTTQVITQRVEGIPGVEDAQVIVLSRVALIALDLEDGVSRRDTNWIKGQASYTAKGFEEVDEVLVTAHPDLVEEVKAILRGDMPLERLEIIYERIRDQRL